MSVQKNNLEKEDDRIVPGPEQANSSTIESLIGTVDLLSPVEETPDTENAEQNQADSSLAHFTEQRVKRISSELSVDSEGAWFLATAFNADFYRNNADIAETDITEEALFEHYLEHGVVSNASPTAAFDPVYVRNSLVRNGLISASDNTPTIESWLRLGFHTIPGHAWFDKNTYLELHPDVASSVSNAYAHFASHGIYENRIPCELLRLHADAVFGVFADQQVDLEAVFRSIPVGYSEQFIDNETQLKLRNIFMPELYRAQIQADGSISNDTLYSHFLLFGAENGYRPTPLFHTEFYWESLSAYKPAFSAADQLQEYSHLSSKYIQECRIRGTASPYFHWFFKGMSLGIVPTPLFDTDHYIYAHQDIKNNWDQHPFMHYVVSGVRENSRKMSVLFDSDYYTSRMGGLEFQDSALLDYILRGQFMNVAPVAGLQLEHFETDNPLVTSTLEQAAVYFQNRTRKLNKGKLLEMVSRATELEPQIVGPYGLRNIRYAPVFHPEVDVMQNMRSIRPHLAREQYDHIVLIPHCRMAGSAKIAGQLTKAVAELTSTESVLVITTDLSNFERPEWFPSGVDVFDLSKHLSGLATERKLRILLDIVRGLNPKKLININSNLGWHLTSNYGKQISSWTDLYIYLFCWDRDEKGNKGGYPIQWFLPTFDYCSAVFTDSFDLRDELRARYCITEAQQNKIVALHTPAENRDIRYDAALEHRAHTQGVRRIFWSGRFDKQKRLDILFAVANRLPNIEFWVWGKSILQDGQLDIADAPSNIKHMGVYSSIDDVPIASCDCFLYTAGWDGLPTVLIEVGSRAIPIVASNVGGVGDIVTDKTGWPIADYANPEAYCEAINELLSNYPLALEKAQSCREHTLELCNTDSYFGTVKASMGLEQG